MQAHTRSPTGALGRRADYREAGVWKSLVYFTLLSKRHKAKGRPPCQIRFNKNTVVPCSSPPPPLRKFSAKPPRHEMTALQQESIQYAGSPHSSPHQKSTTTAHDQDVVSGTGSSATPPLILVLNAKSASVVVSLGFFS